MLGLGLSIPQVAARGSRPLVAAIRSLFAANEPGVWYDPSDLSTLFQDAAGTTPVTAVEQPVGLMLDKSRGGRGPNLTPPTDQPSGWLGAVNNTISNDGSGVVSTNTVNTRVALRVANIIQPGVYEVEVDLEARINSTGSASIRVAFSSSTAFGGALLFPSTMTSIPGEGRHQRRAIVTVTDATHSGLLVGTNASAEIQAGSWIKLHSVSVRRIDGNHASQATTTARPILSARYNLLTSTDTLIGGDWAALAPNTTVTPGFSSPLGVNTAARVQMPATSGSLLNHPFNATAGHTYRLRFLARRGGTSTHFSFGFSTTFNGALGNRTVTNLGDEWQEFFVDYTAPSSGQLWAGIDNVNNGQAIDVLIAGIDLRLVVDVPNLPSYQRVVSSSEYSTEGFPYYLRFDGVDDHLSIPSLDFSGASSAVAVIGMKKLNDVASTRPYSHGVNTGQTGAFRFLAPANPGQASLRAAVRSADGTLSEPAGANDKPAPIKTVMLASYGNGESTTVRFNGSETRVASGGPLAGLVLPNTRAIVGAQVTGDTTQSGYFVGRISGLLHIGRSLSEVERRAVERFINSKTKAY